MSEEEELLEREEWRRHMERMQEQREWEAAMEEAQEKEEAERLKGGK